MQQDTLTERNLQETHSHMQTGVPSPPADVTLNTLKTVFPHIIKKTTTRTETARSESAGFSFLYMALRTVLMVRRVKLHQESEIRRSGRPEFPLQEQPEKSRTSAEFKRRIASGFLR